MDEAPIVIALTDNGGSIDGDTLTGDPEEAFAQGLDLVSRQALSLPEGETITAFVTDARPYGYKDARVHIAAGQFLKPTAFPKRERPKGTAGIPTTRRAHSDADPAPAEQAEALTEQTTEDQADDSYQWPTPVQRPTAPTPQPQPEPDPEPAAPKQRKRAKRTTSMADLLAVQEPTPAAAAEATDHRADGPALKGPAPRRRRAAHRAKRPSNLSSLFRTSSTPEGRRGPRQFPEGVLPPRKAPKGSMRSRLHGTGAPIQADTRTAAVAAHPRALHLVPASALPMQPLTAEEAARVGDAQGFLKYTPRVPAPHADIPGSDTKKGQFAAKKPWTTKRIMKWTGAGLATVVVAAIIIAPSMVTRTYTQVCVDTRTGLRVADTQCSSRSTYYVHEYVQTSKKKTAPTVGQPVTDAATAWPTGKASVASDDGQPVTSPTPDAGTDSPTESATPTPTSTP